MNEWMKAASWWKLTMKQLQMVGTCDLEEAA
jgi:hypothetical protein